MKKKYKIILEVELSGTDEQDAFKRLVDHYYGKGYCYQTLLVKSEIVKSSTKIIKE